MRGDERDEIVTSCRRMAEGIAWSYHRKLGGRIEFDDLRSEALVGLVRAAMAWDPDRVTCHHNSMRRWYIRQYISAVVRTYVSKELTGSKTRARNGRSQNPILRMCEYTDNLAALPAPSMDVSRPLKWMHDCGMTTMQRTVVIMWLLDDKPTMTAIGKRIGKTRQRAYQIYMDGLAKLKRYIEEYPHECR